MSDFERIILLDFLGNNWSAFVDFCEDYEDGLADKIYEELGGEPE